MSNRLVLSVLGLLAVSGCSTYSLEELRHTTPQGNKFQTALSKLYMGLATQQEKGYDWQDSWYFADKGLMAVYGKETVPEDLENWNIPQRDIVRLEKNRADLVKALTPEATQKNPEDAALAQFYFDSWLEMEDAGASRDDIEDMRYQFSKAMNHIGAYDAKDEAPAKPELKNKKVPKVSKIIKKEQPKNLGKLAPSTNSYVLFFDSGESALIVRAEGVLSDVAKSLKGQENYQIVITNKAHDSKEALYKERLAAIKQRLVDLNIKESSVKSSDVAGSPATSTINRKVEIFIND